MNADLSRRDILFGLGTLLGASLLDQTKLANAATPLENAFDQLVREQGFSADGPGLAVLVREPRRILLNRCCGLANLQDRTPITMRTMFELASVSKTMTATAILILAERQKLSVEDDVRKYIPELPAYDEVRPIRLLDLLRHTSGLPKDYMDFPNVPARHKDYWVNEDFVGEFARQREKFPLRFRPGAKYEYNNSNYVLLAVVIERVTKKTYGEFLRETIFVPSGMKNSFVYEIPKAVPKPPSREYVRALGYQKKDDKWTATWGAPPAREEKLLGVGDGGVWTNLEDMSAWDRAFFSNRLLKPRSLRLALTPSQTEDGKVNNYGCGWELYFNKQEQMNGFGHEGNWRGFKTSIYHYLVAGRTTIILSNRGDFDADKFWNPLNDLMKQATGR